MDDTGKDLAHRAELFGRLVREEATLRAALSTMTENFTGWAEIVYDDPEMFGRVVKEMLVTIAQERVNNKDFQE